MKSRSNAKSKRFSGGRVKRSGYVYSLYKLNIINLWAVALVLLAVFVGMVANSFNYLLNYLVYRSEPDAAAFTTFMNENVLDIDEVCADIAANGGENALDRSSTSMFFKDNVYQEGSRYRFSIPIDTDKLVDTGIYYDDNYTAYFDVGSMSELQELMPRENYSTQHLYFYEYDGMQILLVMSTELESEIGDSLRVTFAPMGIYSLYMVKDLQEAGYEGQLYNFFIDARETPVDFEDDDFKDAVMVFPFMLLTLIPAILFTVFPAYHPTYRQLDKYARTTQRAVEMVDENYEEYGVLSRDKKKRTVFLEDWVVEKSTFKTGIQRNYRKQQS